MSDLKMVLTDRAILHLAPAQKGQYLVRDTEMRGFFLIVGAKRKTFTVQGEYWKDGTRSSKRIAVGVAGDISTRDARIKAKNLLARIVKGEFAEAAQDKPTLAPAPVGVTLRQAWERYRTAHMERKERSPATIRGYADHVERLLADWLDKPLRELGETPSIVAERHDKISRENGPNAANGCMRTLRAIYNHARRSHRELPPENPTLAVDWNQEKRRDTAMGPDDLPDWFSQAARLRHAVRREFHLFTLLSGSRPGALCQARIEHFNFSERLLHVPRPKGGAKRAFDIPLSRPMIRCLVRAMRAGRMLLPRHADKWIFVAESAEGHLVVHKERRDVLSKYGNDLRQTYRTLGQAAGLSEVDMHLLMNHSLPGVNAGYITRAKLITGHLRDAQSKLSRLAIDRGTARGPDSEGRIWPLLPSRKIGDPTIDLVAPDPRSLGGLKSYAMAAEQRKANDRARRAA
jgi:integrase